VILTNEGTEALLALGVTPVGAAQSWEEDLWHAHLAAQLAQTQSLGVETGINLEQLAALQPDLILGTRTRQEKIYDQLSAIAPTVFSETIGGDWQKNLQLYADALGKHEKGVEVLAAFAARTRALHDALGERVDEEVSLVRFSPSRNRIYFRNNFPGLILQQIGFARPPAQNRDAVFEEVTKERIGEMAGDRIFYLSADSNPADSQANMEEWTHEPLWLNLDAVKAGKVHRVTELYWNLGGGIASANLMLDELAAIYGVSLAK
jgi:iron complex transport system substrate-binding protein